MRHTCQPVAAHCATSGERPPYGTVTARHIALMGPVPVLNQPAVLGPTPRDDAHALLVAAIARADVETAGRTLREELNQILERLRVI
ncbi:hypothetical protein [Streptomyces sp. NPDC007172]|uniref:hypothetical protein n=1 Tax=Streptomyces sp. NPDC007172 TaxID=3364776 RepID=UPI0036AE1125